MAAESAEPAEDGRAWCCDDVHEGTLHNGSGDARVDGDCGDPAAAAAATAARLQVLAERGRKRARMEAEEDGSAGGAGGSGGGGGETLEGEGSVTLGAFFNALDHFTLRRPAEGGSELALYDALRSPDRALLRGGHFVAEGSLVVEQLLALRREDGTPRFRLVSLLGTEQMLGRLAPTKPGAQIQLSGLGTEQMLGRLAPAIQRADEAYVEDGSRCVAFGGSRADLSAATGFKHSALSVLGIALRPPSAVPLSPWLAALAAAAGMRRPTLLLLDGVIKPENVGSLFRSALAFGVAGVVLSPGCADPLYRKAIRASMGAVFKLPYTFAPHWPEALSQVKAGGYGLLALHLQGSVEHTAALGANGTAARRRRSLVQPRALSGVVLLHRTGLVRVLVLVLVGGLAPSAAAPAAAGLPPLCGLPLAVVVGAEYEGVGEAAARLADERVRIAMAPAMAVDSLHGVDSLNVNVAAAIVLERIFAFNRAEPADE